jgi:hypothetical protein
MPKLSFLRPRAPRHSTIVAYIALILAMGSPAIAAALVGHANLANNAVWSNNVKDNSLTGADINESKLLVSRISNKIVGGQTVSAPQSPSSAPYPLNGGTYSQPKGSSELFVGNVKIGWTAGCVLNSGYRSVNVEFFVDGKSVGTAYASDSHSNSSIHSYQFLTIGGGFATASTATRHVTAQVSSSCDASSTSTPNVLGVVLDVIRFR